MIIVRSNLYVIDFNRAAIRRVRPLYAVFMCVAVCIDVGKGLWCTLRVLGV